MKYAVFTVCAPDYTPEQLLPELKKHGYHGVEWRVNQPNYDAANPTSYWGNNPCTIDVNTILPRAGDIKALCAGYGIEICALGTYVNCSQYDAVAMLLEAAAKMGCPKIRVNSLPYDGSQPHDEVFFAAQAAFAKLVPVAKHFGVQMNVEMHMNLISPSASSARRLVDPFDPAVVGVIYDVGNMVTEGYEAYKLGLEILGPYLNHVHVKNAVLAPDGRGDDGAVKYISKQAPLWEGMASFSRFSAALKAVGYDGYLSAEDFSDELSTDEKLEKNIAYLKKII
jgi:sugar phosphate isomerase/epimerase